jgi:hypothetical protein
MELKSVLLSVSVVRGMLAYNTCVLRTRTTSSRASEISAGTTAEISEKRSVPFRGTSGVGAPFTRSSSPRVLFANAALPPKRHDVAAELYAGSLSERVFSRASTKRSTPSVAEPTSTRKSAIAASNVHKPGGRALPSLRPTPRHPPPERVAC